MDNLSEEEQKAIENISELFKRKDKIVREAQINNCMSSFKLELEQEVEKQNKELMLSKLGEIGKQGCLKCKTVENAVNLRRDNIKLKQEIKALKNDTYWKGYIDKQNEAAEICKQCKYIKNNKIKDKMIEEMSKEINKTTSEKYKIKHICEKGKCRNEECHEDDWNECIKEYFRNEVENNESND